MDHPKLPPAFLDRMERLLAQQYSAFLASYDAPRRYGLRVNTLKCSARQFVEMAGSFFHLSSIPWIQEGFYYMREDMPGKHPYYYAGLYYLQEPSAMTPAALLDVKAGHRVLDLCAAPGGKATMLGTLLKGDGLLVANDVSTPRCKALLKNLEVFGITNAVVTNTRPEKLAAAFPVFFDRILVDAPCSGEGMFRKDESTIRAWTPDKPHACAKTQREIICRAADMLAPGGRMVYSTCTFSPSENEAVIAWLLSRHPEMHLVNVPALEGSVPGFAAGTIGPFLTAAENVPGMENFPLEKCVRLMPHLAGGEGHFLAVLEKDEGIPAEAAEAAETADIAGTSGIACNTGIAGGVYMTGRKDMARRKDGAGRESRRKDGAGRESRRKDRGSRGKDQPVKLREELDVVSSFLEAAGLTFIQQERLTVENGQVNLPVPGAERLQGIPVVRNGLYVGETRKGRFIPSQSLAMACGSEKSPLSISFPADDERIIRYLKGETVMLTEEEYAAAAGRPDSGSGHKEKSDDGAGGYRLICVEGQPLGWAKQSGMQLKNKYLQGWRMS